MKAIFFEEMIDKVMEYLDVENCRVKEGHDVIPLTPKACFQLDMLGIDYLMPDDYLMPEEVDMERFVKSVDEHSLPFGFLIPLAHRKRGYDYWKSFFEVYVKKRKPKFMRLYGERFSICLQVMLEKWVWEGEDERVAEKNMSKTVH